MTSETAGRNEISSMDTGRPAWGGSAGAEENCHGHWNLLHLCLKQFYCTPPSLHTKVFEVFIGRKAGILKTAQHFQ